MNPTTSGRQKEGYGRKKRSDKEKVAPVRRIKEWASGGGSTSDGEILGILRFLGEGSLPRPLVSIDFDQGQLTSVKKIDFSVLISMLEWLVRYALEVAKYGTVAVITKAEPHESNTNYAQGGVCAVLCPSDSVESHMQDTIVAGAYLCDEETVRVVCTEGPARIRELIAMGASFDHGEDGNLHLAREGGHSHHRIVHAADMTGREIERALLEAVRKDHNIYVFEYHFAIDVLTSQEGPHTICHGVDAVNTETQEVMRFISKVTLLASGGAGHVYPSGHWRWDGYGSLSWSSDLLLPEACLIDCTMKRAELAPRDVVARSIDDQLKKRNEKYVLLDISHKAKEKILSHFPNIAAECLRHGLDITRQPIPVVPAAHYMCGGVRAGLQGETNPSIDHMKSSQIDHMASRVWTRPIIAKSLGDTVLNNIVHRTREVRRQLQLIMWEYVGIVRSTTRLQTAEKRIGELELEWFYSSRDGSQRWSG
ncbi:UNVERIFIED_CONTAM: L-aspartate oxidase, chloroplastic [Sesamum calycinum]|uniref:L-aspartate oxidase n=1 Tax=Sesamum calycinum TaxID=2727403 RepID=A0AAW2SU53_9LAMI